MSAANRNVSPMQLKEALGELFAATEEAVVRARQRDEQDDPRHMHLGIRARVLAPRPRAGDGGGRVGGPLTSQLPPRQFRRPGGRQGQSAGPGLQKDPRPRGGGLRAHFARTPKPWTGRKGRVVTIVSSTRSREE